jgi:hypothetical protein
MLLNLPVKPYRVRNFEDEVKVLYVYPTRVMGELRKDKIYQKRTVPNAKKPQDL